jgi:hypothetical protein
MADKSQHWVPGASAPAASLVAITPADVDLTDVPRALYVGGAGNLVLRGIEDSTNVTLVGVPAGTIIPVRAKRIAAATTATNIVGLY